MKCADKWLDYEILGTGDGYKLERWKDVKLLRPDPQVIWPMSKDLSKEKLVLIVTHDNNLSKLYGDRLIKIKDGEITSDEIIHQENVKTPNPSKYLF